MHPKLFTMPKILEVKNLQIKVADKVVIHDLSLSIEGGEVHALMGPNGSGKSTLASALAGHSGYQITHGKVLLSGEDITRRAPEVRAQKGLFLAWQYPVAVPGLSVSDFLFSALNNVRQSNKLPSLSAADFTALLHQAAAQLKLGHEFLKRGLNDGFSGGEKKRLEILQLLMLNPKLAILDETDSGLDIDALKLVAGGVKLRVGPTVGVLVITHYQRLLRYLKPTHAHILVGGRIVESGGPAVVQKIEKTGFNHFQPHHA